MSTMPESNDPRADADAVSKAYSVVSRMADALAMAPLAGVDEFTAPEDEHAAKERRDQERNAYAVVLQGLYNWLNGDGGLKDQITAAVEAAIPPRSAETAGLDARGIDRKEF